MNLGTFIVLVIVAGIVGAILFNMHRNKKIGKNGCSGCSGCGGACSGSCCNCSSVH